MLLLLAAEVSEVEEWSLEDALAIERIAHCAFEGAHVVLAETPKVLQQLQAAPVGTFGAVSRAVFRKLSADYAFQGWLLGSDVAKVAITSAPTVDQVSKRWSRVLSLADIRAMSLEPTTLLAENLIDAKIFAAAGRHYISAEKLRGLEIAAVARGGGGSTIANELCEIVDRADRVCLAITDSDAAWPAASQSETSKKCDALAKKAIVPVEHKSLPVREVENLVPPSILVDLVAQPEHVDQVRHYERLCVNTPEIRSCGDVKDGVRASRLYRLPHGSPEREFLRGLQANRHGFDSRCVREEDCFRERQGGDCECTCVPRIGAIGEKFNTWLSERSAPKGLESFAEPWRRDWLSVGSDVFRWCCSRPRMRG